MNTLNLASLVNFLGFTIGIALYGLLIVMVVRLYKQNNWLLLVTGILGILWNFGEFFTFLWRDFRQAEISPIFTAISYSALGFIPPVVLHINKQKWLSYPAFALSVFAAILHFISPAPPSELALQVLTIGAFILLAVSFIFKPENKLLLAMALIIFAFSVLHLSVHNGEEKYWFVELITHQSSLPLVLVILLQDYRFAFADLFLKRAISLLLLALTAFLLYAFVAVPLMALHENHERNDVESVVLVLTLWIITALTYPKLHQFAVLFVDKLLLKRADYKKLISETASEIETLESPDEILKSVGMRLKNALTVEIIDFTEDDTREFETIIANDFAKLFVPTVEAPFHKITLKKFTGGRYLLSDEIEMLDNIRLIAARRIDAVRAKNKGLEQELKEREFLRLAAEAQLTALRSQINPHFLFNSLTTIGYLIKTSPEKGFETLMRLTTLLRSVLGKTEEFATLGDEIKLINSYLEIERSRFEERLHVKINVANDLEDIRIPAFILQPIVENAVKHGISKIRKGGEVEIFADYDSNAIGGLLKITISDSGAGISNGQISYGVGLTNVVQRLKAHYGDSAYFSTEANFPKGTIVRIGIPVKNSL